MVMRDLTLGGEYTIQHTDNVLQTCIPETYLILLTNVTPINTVKIKRFQKYTNGDRLKDGEQDDSWGGGGQMVEGVSEKEKGLMDMDNSVVIAGGWGVQGTKW